MKLVNGTVCPSLLKSVQAMVRFSAGPKLAAVMLDCVGVFFIVD